MKLKTKFTLLVASCTLALLGSYYLLSVHSANNAFVEFNQKSVVHLTSELLDEDDVEAHFAKLTPSTPIESQFKSINHAFPEQLFILISQDEKSLPHNDSINITYIPVDNGYQFKIAKPEQRPFVVQFSQLQYEINVHNQNYALFWLPRNALNRKHEESLLMSRLADEFMLSLIALSVLAAALSWLGAWYFLKPLQQLKQSFQDIEQGNLNTRISVQNKDEVADILNSFNRLAAWLQGLHQQYRQMNSDLSHELRTPLNAIRSRIEAIEDGILPLEVEQLSLLAKETVSLNQLIDDLSLLSLTESKQLTLQNAPVNISQLLNELVAKYQLQATSLDLQLKSAIATHITYNTDSKRLRQILVNLLDNAFKYGQDGDCVLVSLTDSEQHIDIVIADNGKGMSKEELTQVFERFYRAQVSRSDSNSLGLGLAICKQLAELMNAELTVTSQQNKRTAFTLRLFKKS